MYMYGFYGFDFSYFLFMLPAVIISVWAQIKVKTTFSKYSGIRNSRNLTGAQAAQRVLSHNEIIGVQIQPMAGSLTDNFNPKNNTISLSSDVYDENSIAAVGVAAHEAGHAVQYGKDYLPLKIRKVLVPAANFGTWVSFPLIFLGFILPVQYDFVIYLGIAMFSLAVLFQVITLPVELDASRRAIRALEETNTLYDDELIGAKKVLNAAALTYLAAAFSAILNLLRILLLLSGRRGRD